MGREVGEGGRGGEGRGGEGRGGEGRGGEGRGGEGGREGAREGGGRASLQNLRVNVFFVIKFFFF